jgi:hypothetical protein
MIESTITREEFAGLVTSASFHCSMVRLAIFTERSDAEGAYILRGNSKPILDLPNLRSRVSRLDVCGLSALEAAFSAGVSYNGGKYLGDGRRGGYRSDIKIFIHSHPPIVALGRPSDSGVHLAPSQPDMKNWEDRDVRSPGHVSGVLAVASETDAKLLVWRLPSGAELLQRYVTVDCNSPASRMVHAMKDSGIRVAELGIHQEMAQYVEDSSQAAQELFQD